MAPYLGAGEKQIEARQEQVLGGPKGEPPRPTQRSRGKFPPGVSGNPSGRRRGAVSRQTIAALVKEHGSPLEFLLKTMNDNTAKMADRLRAAEVAIGFVHRRLPEHTVDSCPPIEEPPPLSRAAARALRQTARAPRRRSSAPPNSLGATAVGRRSWCPGADRAFFLAHVILSSCSAFGSAASFCHREDCVFERRGSLIE